MSRLFYDPRFSRDIGLGSTFFSPPADDDDDKTKDKGGGGGDDDKTDYKAEAEKWKKLSRDNEARAKANADAAKKLEELEAADKTELEKAKDGQAKAEEKASANERELLRLRIAVRHGLSETQAKRLVGVTEEELDVDAKELLETFSGSKKETNEEEGDGSSKPKENLKSGFKPGDKVPETDPGKLADLIPRSAF